MRAMAAYAKERALDRIAELAGGCGDLVTFWRESTEVARTRRPVLLDALLVHARPGVPARHEPLPRGDARDPRRVARATSTTPTTSTSSPTSPARERGISTLHEATGGDPSSSPRWHANMELGGDQEMIARAAARRAGTSGARSACTASPAARCSTPRSSPSIEAVAPHLAEGARTVAARRRGQATPRDRTRPGSSCSPQDWEVESATPGVERWLAELPDGDWDAGTLPPSVLAVAGRALRTAEGRGRIRARSRSPACCRGRAPGWSSTAPASSRGASARVAVIVEPAHPARITPLLMSAYGLTEREQEVTRLVLQGDSTAQIAERLSSHPTPSRSTSRASSRRPACAAGASSSARCSSPTTSRACATTNGGPPTGDRCAAGR